MSSMTDKAKGLANEAAGNVKQGVGKAVGSEKMEAEGVAQEAKGDAQKAVGNAKGAVKGAADSAAAAVHRKLVPSDIRSGSKADPPGSAFFASWTRSRVTGPPDGETFGPRRTFPARHLLTTTTIFR